MTSLPRALRTIALYALVLSSFSASPVRAATDAQALSKPSRVFTTGTLRVEQYGAGSPAMIFVPGLSCGSWV